MHIGEKNTKEKTLDNPLRQLVTKAYTSTCRESFRCLRPPGLDLLEGDEARYVT